MFINKGANMNNISAIKKSYDKWDNLYWEAVMLSGIVGSEAFGPASSAAIKRCNRRIRHFGYILSKVTKTYGEARAAEWQI